MNQNVILFDINETVLDLSALKPKFKYYLGEDSYMDTWFSMLLHSSTVCMITDVKTDFKCLAKAALDALSGRLKITLSQDDCDDIIGTLASLPAHNDIKPALLKLREADFKLVAFSNSSLALLSSQLKNAQLECFFDEVISVESAGTFKPSQEAYQFAVKKFNVPPYFIRLVATHDWDTHGALSAGLKAAFIDRLGYPYNPEYQKPNIIGNTMDQIAEQIILARTI
ncbi:haloacid dehalogenase type II [Psychromonas sp. KJ10-10]|uniref:haloacid dehalogenase type II n=1 Tax=Psychromonas sp. KJ10-10 TaxID=3391823 RepID=UPI0039B5DAD1